MSSHTEKLLELELELRSLRQLRDEMESLRGTLDTVRTRLSALEQGGRGGSGSAHTLGQYRIRSSAVLCSGSRSRADGGFMLFSPQPPWRRS